MGAYFLLIWGVGVVKIAFIFEELFSKYFAKFFGEFISVRLHAAPHFAPAQNQEKNPGELFTYGHPICQ